MPGAAGVVRCAVDNRYLDAGAGVEFDVLDDDVLELDLSDEPDEPDDLSEDFSDDEDFSVDFGDFSDDEPDDSLLLDEPSLEEPLIEVLAASRLSLR